MQKKVKMFSFLNFHKDPSDKSRYVFYHKDPQSAAEFIKLCDNDSLPYKKLKDPQNPDVTYLSFSKEDFDQAQRLNAEALSKSPKSFLPDKGLRIFTLSLFFIMTTIAIIGYLVTKFR